MTISPIAVVCRLRGLTGLLLLSLGAVSARGVETILTTIADLEALPVATYRDGAEVKVRGYHGPDDAGGGVFVYDQFGTEAVDRGMVFSVSTKMGRWLRKWEGGPVQLIWFGAETDGKTDSTELFRQVFAEAQRRKSSVLINPGNYVLNGKNPIFLSSGLIVEATNAVMQFPQEDFPGQRIMFSGESVNNIRWHGGQILGHRDRWSLSSQTIGIKLSGPDLSNLEFNRIYFQDLNGPGLAIRGLKTNYATKIRIRNSKFERCGVTMYDWQDPQYKAVGGMFPPGVSWELIGMLKIEGFNDLIVENCVFQESRGESMDLNGGLRLTFRGNKVLRSGFGGIFARYITDSQFIDNTVDGSSSRGFTLEGDCRNIKITNCSVSNSGRESMRIQGTQQNVDISGAKLAKAGLRTDKNKDAEIRVIGDISGLTIRHSQLNPSDTSKHVLVLEPGVRSVELMDVQCVGQERNGVILTTKLSKPTLVHCTRLEISYMDPQSIKAYMDGP
jgi:hypothetical protein